MSSKRRAGCLGAIGWTLALLFAVWVSAAWVALFAVGGMVGVFAWLVLLAFLPWVGIAALLAASGVAWRERRFTFPSVLTVIIALIAIYPGAWAYGVGRFAYPSSLEDTRPTATVRLPLDVPLRVAWGGNELSKNYHAFTPDQRWAYDLVVDPNSGGSTHLEDYGCWGKEIVAPTDARVHLAHDSEPDVEPSTEPNNPDKPLGNFVVLELPTQTYLIIAHLQRGSVQAREGESVREGQVLGRCGNSGNTSEPHVHIHHQRQDPAHFPVGFAEGLPLFFRGHDGPRMPEGGVREENDRLIPLAAPIQHRGNR